MTIVAGISPGRDEEQDHRIAQLEQALGMSDKVSVMEIQDDVDMKIMFLNMRLNTFEKRYVLKLRYRIKRFLRLR